MINIRGVTRITKQPFKTKVDKTKVNKKERKLGKTHFANGVGKVRCVKADDEMAPSDILIGPIAGVIVVVLIVGVVIYILCKRYKPRRKRKRDIQHSDHEEAGTAKKRCIRNTITDFADEAKGLPNVGNTCYTNSMLQCLAWSPCLRTQLEDQIKKQTYSAKGNKVAKALLDVLECYHDDSDNEYDDDGDCFVWCNQNEPKSIQDKIYTFLRAISQSNGKFGGGVQEDTFEFYNTLLSTLQEEALENTQRSNKDETYDELNMRRCGVLRLFKGKFLTSYCYTACGHVDTVFQSFTSLIIPVNETPKSVSTPVVVDREMVSYQSEGSGGRYGSFSDREQLLSDPEGEKQDVNGTKRISVKTAVSPGDISLRKMSLDVDDMDGKQTGVELGLTQLTETEKMDACDVPCRLCKDGNTGAVYKKLQMISLPPILVLQLNRFKQRGGTVCKIDQHVSYPKVLDMARFCSVSMEQVSEDRNKLTYSLFGVVNHHGSMKGGHYTAYIKTTYRNVKNIQTQLQKHEWRDPERFADDIRSRLEEIWQGQQEEDSDQKFQRKMHSESEFQHNPTGESDRWFCISDSYVRGIDENTVMQNAQAYILMYERNQTI